jgi:Recombinase zinc beta ribbon domain/Recombinase/MerR HTH family regulatory protein
VQAFERDRLRFPIRVRSGERKGELLWMPLRHWRVLRTLHNPRYAGAFVFGRRRTRKDAEGKTTVRELPREQWTALIPDAHPGYISWQQFETNQRLLAGNAQAYGVERAAGPAREGPALLQGLVVCGRCGRRMTVRYHQRRGTLVPDYQCIGESIQGGGPRCQTIPGHGVDAAIGQLLLETVTPLALEVALTVQAELEARADEADRLRRSHVERARQRAELARRRYLTVDPDNRLVADTLEADWNDALRALQAAQDEYERANAAANATLGEEQKQRVRALAADFPALWTNPATPQRERKRMVRLLIEDVTLTKTDQIHLHVRFPGGTTTSHAIPIPLSAWKARETSPDTLALLDLLLDQHTDAETAAALNATGHRSGEGKPFTNRIVLHLRRDHHLPSHADRLRAHGLLTLDEIAARLGVYTGTIKDWHRAGLLRSEKANDKNERLYHPPTPGDPRLVKQQGRRLDEREPVESTPGGSV